MKFSATYKPTALFSLRDSNSTSSGAKTLLLPSPYAIKMALLNQAISLGGENFNDDGKKFEIVRDVGISYFIKGNFCVNNCFVKIQKQRDGGPFISSVSFREYVFLDDEIEIFFEVKNEEDVVFLKQYLYRINYFGKRGCFFQFVKYNDNPNNANVCIFDVYRLSPGLLQEYDDFGKKVTFENVNTYSSSTTKREKSLLVLPLASCNSSKSFTSYKTFLKS